MHALGFLLPLAALLSSSSGSVPSGSSQFSPDSATLMLTIPSPASSLITNPSQSFARVWAPDGLPLCPSSSSTKSVVITGLTGTDTFKVEIPSCAYTTATTKADVVDGRAQQQQQYYSRSFLVSVDTRDGFIPQIRIDITSSTSEVGGGKPNFRAWNMVPGGAWNEPSSEIPLEAAFEHENGVAVVVPLPNPIVKEYYAAKPGFRVLSLLKNPMVLMAVVTLFMAIGLPRLLDLVDPETKAEFAAYQKEQRNKPAVTGPEKSAVSQADVFPSLDLTGWLAKKTAGPDSPAVPDAKPAPNKSTKNSNRKA